MPRILFYTLIFFLFAIGTGLIWLRHIQTEIPLLPGKQVTVWLVEARVTFSANGNPVEVSLDIPYSVPGYRTFNEQTASPGYGFSVLDINGNRRAVWSVRSAMGPQTLYYKLLVSEAVDSNNENLAPPDPVVEIFWEESQGIAARQVLALAHSQSDSRLSMCRELIKQINAKEKSQNIALLLSQTPPVLLLEKLLHYAGIPTRIVNGLYLEENRHNLELEPMLEIYTTERWIMLDPDTGQHGRPDNFFLWDHGGTSILDVSGGRYSNVSFGISAQTISAKQLALTTTPPEHFVFFDMHKLPVEEQNMLKVMLLLPLGALAVVFMSVIIGIRTSGTFMPILIALSFLQTSLVPGLISFVAIVAFGLLLRSYLSHFNLLLVARISTIVVLVLMIIVISSLFGYQIGVNTRMSVTFFPVIIIAWTIERMSILWEDAGPREVLLQGGGSLFVAICAFMLMSWPLAAHLSFNFPEINLIILALLMGMGSYTGYKLTELRRFRALRLKLGL
ncbi:MAG: inactive transglutaminase family protein [Desulfuromonadaceae bacterium]|nr:inactive transglutaminase family protein [Desulfuromonas sp.]MDY0184389.1 inactive transglutaminase family protein [Desulfuromonadaceae bacterium]